MTKDEFLTKMDPRPRYDKQYEPLFKLFPKLEKNQMYLAAFIIGIHLDKCTPTAVGNRMQDIYPLRLWSSREQRDVVFYLLLERSPKWDNPFSWNDIENADDTLFMAFKQEFNRMMNGYANTGFEYIQQKNQEDPTFFKQPFALIDLLVEVADSWNKEQ